MVNKVSIQNVEDSLFVSDLLNDVIKMSSELTDTEVEIERRTIEGTKGEIIIGILIGLATNTTYDLLKTALLRLKTRPDYDKKVKIHIEENEFTLDYIQEHNSTEFSFKKK